LVKIRTALILFLFYKALFCADIEFKASINSDKIGIDDVLIYKITFKGIDNPIQPDISYISNFRVIQTSKSSEYRFINGRSSFYTSFDFFLQPLSTGKLKLPPVSYKYKDKEYKTESFAIEVAKGSTKPYTPPKKKSRSIFDFDDDSFSSPFDYDQRQKKQKIDIKLQSFVSKNNVVVGEKIIYKVMLYTQNRIASINMLSNQSFPGFWQEWYPVPRSIDGNVKQINDKIYQVYEIRKAALFPTKSGELYIPALKFELSLSDDSFSFFSSPRRVFRFAPAVKINVNDLPENAKNLSVGNFRFNVSSDKHEININDILTLKLEIKGNGNIKILDIPEFKSNNYFKVYPSKITRSYDYKEDKLTGTIYAEIPISFKKKGVISFPVLEFKYYEPLKGKIITKDSHPIIVKVVGEREMQEGILTLPRSDIVKKGEDIDFIKKGKIYNQDECYYNSTFFKIFLIIPFVLNILFIIKKFIFDNIISKNKILNKKKLINKTIKRLNKVSNYEDVYIILEGYLKEKSGFGLSEINVENIKELFRKFKINDYDTGVFIRMKSESESSKFSPHKKSAVELRKNLKLLIEVLKRVDTKVK